MIRYAKPRTLDEALTLLGEAPWRILAGGTDFYPALGNRPPSENVLDINGLAELRGISETTSHIVVGARTTWTDLIRHPLPPAFDALKQAAREVGSVQIQNVASLAGNLCNASPAADGAPALMVLDAEVELRSLGGVRVLPLSQFLLGNRRTAIRLGEIATAVRIPKRSIAGSSSFQKLGARRYLVISIAMAAARMALGPDGAVERAAIAVGSCSAVAQRLPGLEAALAGLRPGREIAKTVEAAGFEELSPIDDVRGSADYRRAAAREIVQRAVAGALERTVAGVAA
ncbi:xanthine dehydrogenase family protein subunit M [Mesorhizobium sp. KR9-304]|uniref:FAD binding domain-containing protein n=1 Tax=Mesorhizobium sp. KR9-304 TaxID=3156614 RepID=UPI0032B46C15